MQRERDAISGSQTVTTAPTPEREFNEASGSNQPVAQSSSEQAPVLKLRLVGRSVERDIVPPRVAWSEDVVDNEHLGRKSSKSTSFHIQKRYALTCAPPGPSLLHLSQTPSVRRIIFRFIVLVVFL